MERAIEQTLSKPTLQFGLRPEDYLILAVIGTVGSFFLSKVWLLIILGILIGVFRYVNKSKRRYFWSSVYIWLTTNTNLEIRQSRKLPPVLKD